MVFKFALKNDNLQVTTKDLADTTTGVGVAQGTLETPAWTLVAVTIDLDKSGNDSSFFVGADSYTTLTQSSGWGLGSWLPIPSPLAPVMVTVIAMSLQDRLLI